MQLIQYTKCNAMNSMNECNAMTAIQWMRCKEYNTLNAVQWINCDECNAIKAMQLMQYQKAIKVCNAMNEINIKKQLFSSIQPVRLSIKPNTIAFELLFS